jgi:hypothetical protein
MTMGSSEGGKRLPSNPEERYHAVMRYLAQLLWAAGAADESIAVLSALACRGLGPIGGSRAEESGGVGRGPQGKGSGDQEPVVLATPTGQVIPFGPIPQYPFL